MKELQEILENYISGRISFNEMLDAVNKIGQFAGYAALRCERHLSARINDEYITVTI